MNVRLSFQLGLLSLLMMSWWGLPVSHGAETKGKKVVETDPTDKVMGNWKGRWTATGGQSGQINAKLIGRGDGKYEGTLYIPNPQNAAKPITIAVKGTGDGTKGKFSAEYDLGADLTGKGKLKFDIDQGMLKGEFTAEHVTGKFQMSRFTYKSQTLGAKPPEGAVVLFNGKDFSQWTMKGSNEPVFWKITDDGAMQVQRVTKDGKTLKGSVLSKPTFQDARIHVEFRTPYMPFQTGQARGNSGVYVQGRYEVQVLDSFGLPPKDNEAGGIYKASVPRQNASLPPGEWQTYDINFRAPRFDAEGKMTEKARITVVYNDVTIHSNVALPGPTPGGAGGDVKQPGGLLFQDHGNPVQFRNVWFVPVKTEAKK